MSFYSATYLLLLILVPLVFIAAYLRNTAREKARNKFASPQLFMKIAKVEPQSRMLVRTVLVALAVVLLVIAFARPQGGERVTEEQVEGIDIILAIDISRSMLARDLHPDRLSAIKSTVNRFIDSSYGDRIGVVAFAGDAVVMCPLTTDHGAVRSVIDRLTTDETVRPGTGIGNAISVATTRLKNSEAGRVVILLTDGENNKGIEPMEAVEQAKSEGIRVYTVGIGTSNGAALPEADQPFIGPPRYRIDEGGELITVGLDAQTLQDIADETGGRFFQVTNQRELANLYSSITHEGETQFQQRRVVRRDELAPYFLFLACLLLIMEAFYAYFIPTEVSHAKA